jgi:hypothetical protein
MVNERLLYMLTTLVAAHLLADFTLQSDYEVEHKRNSRWDLFLWHGMVHALLAYLLVGCWWLWQPMAALALVHILIDVGKEGLRRAFIKNDKTRADATRNIIIIIIDQALHLTTIIIIAIICSKVVWSLQESTWFVLTGQQYVRVCISAAGLVVAVSVGALVIGTLTAPLLAEMRPEDKETKGLPESRGFTKGGRLVGQLERALVFLLVMTGNLSAVGFLAAAKSVFRFGEITDAKQRKEAEYILIGTLMSFTWAVAVALLTTWLVRKIVP